MSERKYIPMDDVFTGIDRTVKLLNYMLGERTQLYGTIIYLMQMLEKDKVAMPTVEAMHEYHNSFSVRYDVDEAGDFYLSLVEREEPVTPPEDTEGGEDGE